MAVTGFDAEQLEAALPECIRTLRPEYLAGQRWFGSKSRRVEGVALRDGAVYALPDAVSLLTLVEVRLAGGDVETYYLPLVAREPADAARVADIGPEQAAAVLPVNGGQVLLYDAFADPVFCVEQLRHIAAARVLPGQQGRFSFVAVPSSALPLSGTEHSTGAVQRLQTEQSNTSVLFGDALIMKSFRRLQDGVNPDLEVSRFLTTGAGFRNVPPLAGYVTYAGADGFDTSIAMLQRFVPNEGDGWRYTLDHLRRLYGLAHMHEVRTQHAAPLPEPRRVALVRTFSGDYLRSIVRLGRVTGELHAALSSATADPAFTPEPVTAADIHRWIVAMHDHMHAVLQQVEGASSAYPPALQAQVTQVVLLEDRYREIVAGLAGPDATDIVKIRHHGDYHLGQVLRTEDDFVILDFEGEPARPVCERRQRHLALRDVAGMLRSFDYAMFGGLFAFLESESSHPATLERWGRAWQTLARRAFLRGYLAETLDKHARFVPSSRREVGRLLAIFELEKAVYELGYEANNRPHWVQIPLRHLATCVQGEGKAGKGKRKRVT